MFLAVLIAIAILFLIILVHELGHFISARLFGMKTPVVGLGLPFWGPTWIIFKTKNIEFRLHPVLLGAYVAIPEMDDESAKEFEEQFAIELGEKREFPMWQKIIVSAAGSLANIIFALLLTFILIFSSGKPVERIMISTIENNASQEIKENFKAADLIIQIQDKKILKSEDLINILGKNKGKQVNVIIERENKLINLNLKVNEEGRFGISISSLAQFKKDNTNFIQNIKYSFEQFANYFAFCFSMIKKIIISPFLHLTGQGKSAVQIKELSGIIKVTEMLAKIVQEGFPYAIQLWAVFSIYIGLFNLIPLLPLDGGHILFQIIEIFTGRSKIEKIREYTAQIGLTLCLMLVVIVTLNDLGIWKLIDKFF